MWLSLGLVDLAMDKSTNNFFTHVGNNEFMQTLIQILNQKEMHLEVSYRCLPTSSDQEQSGLLNLEMGPPI
jgi:hypothetical protein